MNRTPEKRFPDFLCIGAQKAGTTWLHQALCQHPDIWLPPFKEIQYFSRLHARQRQSQVAGPAMHEARRTESILNATKGVLNGSLPSDQKLARVYCLSLIAGAELTDDWYGRIFASAPARAVCGEISPDYALLRSAGIQHILRLQPRCKFIYIMRDPIERGWSYLRMGSQRGIPTRPQRVASWACMSHSDYASTIERYRRYVAPENFLTLYFDEIERNPREVLGSVCSFLGVDAARAAFANMDKHVNAGEKRDMDLEIYARFREAFAPIYDRLLRLDSSIVRAWYKHHYESAMPVPSNAELRSRSSGPADDEHSVRVAAQREKNPGQSAQEDPISRHQSSVDE